MLGDFLNGLGAAAAGVPGGYGSYTTSSSVAQGGTATATGGSVNVNLGEGGLSSLFSGDKAPYLIGAALAAALAYGLVK